MKANTERELLGDVGNTYATNINLDPSGSFE